eukprot:CAMPEP_0194529008 /NCGR_PEP_ID=MMETSP0253-20130528/65571_1 /TAXON_ID=2966 /ORGANISM="Noctiluca scintillans" /LENGTH=48 /DNA_ID= /DNA_START= /DNA_END= /DNA_ORIENTATION=
MTGTVSWTCVWLVLVCMSVADDQTSVTDTLNTMIERGSSGVYTGGKGV